MVAVEFASLERLDRHCAGALSCQTVKHSDDDHGWRNAEEEKGGERRRRHPDPLSLSLCFSWVKSTSDLGYAAYPLS